MGGFRELRDHVDPQDSEAHQEKVIQDKRYENPMNKEAFLETL